MTKVLSVFEGTIVVVAGTFVASLLALAFVLPYNAEAAVITRQLDVGMSNPDVTSLQNFLAANSQIYPAGLVTGYYGPMTQTAVAQFQIAYGLPAVGRVGPMTSALINSMMNSGTAIDAAAPYMSNIQVVRTSGYGTVSWSTHEQTRGIVYYSANPVYTYEVSTALTNPVTSGSAIADQNLSTSHSITITGLQSGQVYYYVIHSTDPTGNVSITLPATFIAQ